MVINTVSNNTTAVAEALGYCSKEISFEISRPTLADWLPDMIRTVKKSPITSVTTKIVPIMMPGFVRGKITFHKICDAAGPAVTGGLDQAFVDPHHGV